MTAFLMGRPNATSAVFFIFSSTMAEICSGVKSLGSSSTSTSMMGLPVALSSLTVNGMILISSWHSLNWRPMMRLTLKSVRLVFCAAWRLAESPTRVPDERFQGWADRLHGGIIGLLVDEMLVYAGAPHGLWGMTAKVRYWLRKPVPLEGVELTLRGRLVQSSGRGFRAVVSVHSGDVLVAEGEGMCVLRDDSPRPE